MIHYEAICLGEILRNNTYLMLDLANCKLTTINSLVKGILNGTAIRDVDVSVQSGNDRTYRIDFSNIIYNVQTNQVEYKDGVDESRHYKWKYLPNGRFEPNSQDLMILGKIADRFVIFSPGYTKRFENMNLTDEVLDRMFIGFQNIQAQAGSITVLDEAFAIGLNKIMKFKYINARVSTPSGRKPYMRSYANGFPQLLKEVSDDRKKLGNCRDISIWMIKVAMSAIESSKLIDKNEPEVKKQTFDALLNLGKRVTDRNAKIHRELYEEIVRLFNSQDEKDNIFILESVRDIDRSTVKKIRDNLLMEEEQKRKKEEATKPITDIGILTDNYVSGIISGFATASFRNITNSIKDKRNNYEVVELVQVKKRHEFKVLVQVVKMADENNPFNTKITVNEDNDLIGTVEYLLRLDETNAHELYYRGLVNVTELSTKMHNKIFWNK